MDRGLLVHELAFLLQDRLVIVDDLGVRRGAAEQVIPLSFSGVVRCHELGAGKNRRAQHRFRRHVVRAGGRGCRRRDRGRLRRLCRGRRRRGCARPGEGLRRLRGRHRGQPDRQERRGDHVSAAHKTNYSAVVIGPALAGARAGGRMAAGPGWKYEVLDSGRCEPLKMAVHAVLLGTMAVCALYNSAAWLKRRERHLAINAVLYTTGALWERYHVMHHLAACDRALAATPTEPRPVLEINEAA